MSDSESTPAVAEGDDDQPALFGPAAMPRPGTGRTERDLERSVRQAIATKVLDPELHAALIAAARNGARALDQAEIGTGPKAAYATASVLTPYREVLQALGLAPEQLETPTAGGAAAFLADLANPSPP